MEDNLKLTNTCNNISYEINGKTWEKILQLSYDRNKELFNFLKEVTQVLEAKNFNMSRVEKEKKW